jgi:aspartate aminotransferase
MEADPAVLNDMISAFKDRRTLVLEALSEMPGIKTNHPGGAFYVFPDCSAYFGKSYDGNLINNSNDLCLYLLEESLVALVTGEAFGDPNCFRISYAASEETLKEAMRRIGSALSKLK